ncbi:MULTISPECIES: hypothetical protein [Acinetobacter]|uniref:hypothetical protein n=1 Tax=Acinetobacter TaxID=469 RepID=UPI000C5BE554|nr:MULTISPECIES: hypothetical protein [unclassified Acinetobacter]MBC68549.1 hypothetical protein [Acinetobacter sp.]MBT50723.1 hypothetical protein [Acinetobacter sp.]
MWIQKQINISQRSFLFSILVHALLLSFILKSALYIKIDTPKEMKVVLIPLPQASQSHKENIVSASRTDKINQTNAEPKDNTVDHTLNENPSDLMDSDTKELTKQLDNDPLAEARYRAEKAVKDAKIIADEYRKNIRPIDEHSIARLEGLLENEDPNTDQINHLYKVEILTDKINDQKYEELINKAAIFEPNVEESKYLVELRNKLNLLIEEDVLKQATSGNASIKFTIDPENLIILLEIFTTSSDTEQHLQHELGTLDYDALFINSNLNDRPYSISFELDNLLTLDHLNLD